MTDSCGNCLYMRTELKQCRRFPPSVIVRNSNREYSEYPIVTFGDWCGEWTPNKKLELENEGGST